MRTFRSSALALAFISGAAIAQQPAATGPTGAQPPPPRATDSDAVKAKRERLVAAGKLPQRAQEARAAGVPDSDVKEAMSAARSKGVKADEMSEVAAEHARAAKEHGPIDNFGAFVRSKLDQGLRGRDLAAAIREEHIKRGKGKGPKPKADEGKDRKDKDEKGKPEDRDKGGPPKEKGPPGGKGKGKGGG